MDVVNGVSLCLLHGVHLENYDKQMKAKEEFQQVVSR